MSEAEQPTTYDFMLPYGGPVMRLNSLEQMRDWWRTQLPLWKKLRPNQASAYEYVAGVYRRVEEVLDAAIAQRSKPNMAQLKELIENTGLVFLESARGQFIEQLSTIPTIPVGHHVDAVSAGLALLSNQYVATENGRLSPGSVSGMYAAMAFLEGGPSAMPFYGRGFESLYEKYAAQVKDLRDVPSEVAAAKQMYEAATKEQERKLASEIERLESTQKRQIIEFMEKEKLHHSETIEKIDSWGELLKLDMAAGKPIEYWDRRATECHRTAIRLFVGFGIVCVLAVIAISYSFSSFTDAVHQATGERLTARGFVSPPQSVIVSVIAVEIGKAAAILTICFWILRTILRTALSNYHISQDAAERVAMARTYLALIAENAAAHDGDRKIVLEALFRRGGTGIYREDAAPPSIGVQILKPGVGGSKDDGT